MTPSRSSSSGAVSCTDFHSRWLARCEGFLVEAPGGRLGFVEHVVTTPAHQPRYLSIRAGRSGTRMVLVAVEDVAAVLPDEERVVLRGQLILEAA